ncbi:MULTISPECIES: D-arabinono-1,4-lactone oxidase [Actinoalloteichus]|uniref:FAD/FMN-dependent dehydrogenase n=1 Tax=Actinoalloteichus fjordicus TaxID=1612552 RepID=A0AAC9PRY0_9PSEU|nr:MULTISPECIES: D-arabinono-1,4-lactone oxidase [Actinoalloteichus]APU14929.1 FAD/FMN-dependent dehydrogenase [Actinoalloteichus fjordicus]APU20999.1 FAD/FMN-dependent dehydrogenase [Actinoalloteichus sp. GBA129-24]
MTITTRTNWSGSVTFAADRVESPRSVDQVRELVTGSRSAHVVGAGHSFNRIADTTGTLISLDDLPAVFDLRQDTVRVGAGMRLAELAARLHAHGVALPALPSLPHITAAGACATATHGSGTAIGSLAGLVRSVDLVTADGSTLRLDTTDEDFAGSVVSLGALGVVVAMELAVCPAFDVAQRVFQDMPWEALVTNLDAVLSCAYSVSAFTTWSGTAEVWTKVRTGDPSADLRWTGAREATEPRHPVPGQPAHHCTTQLGEPGPWHERLPHFRADFTPSVGAELQSEYFVAREHAPEALRALADLHAEFAPVLLTSEIRTIDADEHWLSPTYRRPSVAVHFTWRPDAAAVGRIVLRIEEALAPWATRPHWGKLFALPPEVLRARYERWDDFRALLDRHDPTRRFRNDLVEGWFG